ncbi:hydroxyethylthiazole kinase [Methanogenium organophilum]|uniref:Hydroxyethylthiazole kinase n=1 Tax=Methanogenium organophilum TaxID=2199 RepID=A0A9X9S6S8_METOG|nr:hydroxyethylthiazole kinase [Methanogenium organophilum]WAI02526.1 hydroxyethylthiazole kinase [Methanogenium organophilum]
MDPKSIADALTAVRHSRPLVHHITNTVTTNDCANITLCTGAAPVMAAAPEEAGEMAALAGAVVLNIGTLSAAQVESMLIAGRAANERGIPVILDPVGAGATAMRTEACERLLAELDIAVLKGNAGEIGVLAGAGGEVRGVDSAGLAGDPAAVAASCARTYGTVVVMTGPEDYISDGERTLVVGNGNPLMGCLSGTGCMTASVVGAFVAAGDDAVVAAAAACASFSRAGERAAELARGPYSFRTALFDEMANLTEDDLAAHADVRDAGAA